MERGEDYLAKGNNVLEKGEHLLAAVALKVKSPTDATMRVIFLSEITDPEAWVEVKEQFNKAIDKFIEEKRGKVV